jgi:hypothetical protein
MFVKEEKKQSSDIADTRPRLLLQERIFATMIELLFRSPGCMHWSPASLLVSDRPAADLTRGVPDATAIDCRRVVVGIRIHAGAEFDHCTPNVSRCRQL